MSTPPEIPLLPIDDRPPADLPLLDMRERLEESILKAVILGGLAILTFYYHFPSQSLQGLDHLMQQVNQSINQINQ